VHSPAVDGCCTSTAPVASLVPTDAIRSGTPSVAGARPLSASSCQCRPTSPASPADQRGQTRGGTEGAARLSASAGDEQTGPPPSAPIQPLPSWLSPSRVPIFLRTLRLII
jgi:hypothetical protein